jgi:NADH-quinone oxidoreductase subunit G
MPKLIIDGKEIEVSGALTLLQACEAAGAEIPRFCYHERLSIAGNCRMCLVEVVGMPKPQASCALGVSDLPPNRDGTPKIINTKTPLVKKAREGVMEFLLINHPLDCPICDQGGECDLQDQAMAYGVDTTRYGENKRAVEDKNLGPLVKTSMTRCIQCTRCVRFMAEIAGVEDIGASGRGSEMHANIIDICPVGALTSKPYAFMARPWELKKTESIDVMDAVGSAIRVDTRGREVMRILPRTNDAINEEWISDKTRYVADGLRTQRLDQPYVRRDGKLEPASWDAAFDVIAGRMKVTPGNKIGAIAGDLAAAEEMFALKDLLTRLGSVHVEARTDGALLDPRTGRPSYTFNTTIAGLEQADALLLIGTNPRLEATVLNARIRKRWRSGALKVGLIGTPADLTYDVEHLGAGPAAIQDLLDGKGAFARVLRNARRPALILGTAALARADGLAVQSAAARLAAATGMLKPAEGWNGFNVLHSAASRVAALDLGFVSGERVADFANLDLVWLLGAEEFDMARLGKAFVVYQGTHGDAGAHRADVILPGAAYTEKSGTYVNTEGRAQVTAKAGFAPGDAKEDWTILRAFSEKVGQKLPYDTIQALRAAMYQTAPGLARIGTVVSGDISAECVAIEALAKRAGNLGDAPFGVMIRDTYLTNPIARASAVMAELSATGAQRGAGVVKPAVKTEDKMTVDAHG